MSAALAVSATLALAAMLPAPAAALTPPSLGVRSAILVEESTGHVL
jgi:D-alanyl-D-alanine carboxypeptidase